MKVCLCELDADKAKVQVLMIKLRSPIDVAKPKKFEILSVQQKNVTRCLSEIFMMKRYREIRDFVNEIDYEQKMNMIPSLKGTKEINICFVKFRDLQSFTVELQREDKNMAEARPLLYTGTYICIHIYFQR